MTREISRRVLIVVAVVGCNAVVPLSARAAKAPPPVSSTSAVSEYIEQIPTSTGSTAVVKHTASTAAAKSTGSTAAAKSTGSTAAVNSTGEASSRSIPLPKAAQEKLSRSGGKAKSLLQAIATQRALGAQPSVSQPTAATGPPTDLGASPSPLHAALDAGGGTIELLIGLAGLLVMLGLGPTIRRRIGR